jgi:hypothetical protein
LDGMQGNALNGGAATLVAESTASNGDDSFTAPC